MGVPAWQNGRRGPVLVVRDDRRARLAGALVAAVEPYRSAIRSPRRQSRPDMSVPREQTLYYRRSRFTTHLPRDRRYSPAHYWLLEESAGVWRVGLTKFATRMLGDIVEFEFSVRPGTNVAVGDEIGSIEGLKAVTSVFAVGSGVFLGEGTSLRKDVTLAESDPYGEGWLYRLQGEPAPDAVDVQGYVAILDATIDRMLASRHAGMAADEDSDDGSARK